MLFFVSEHLLDGGTNFYVIGAENESEIRRAFDDDADLEISPNVEYELNRQYGGFAMLGTV